LVKLKKRGKELEDARKKLHRRLRELRHGRWQKRTQKAHEYTDKLDGVIKINVLEGGDRREFEKKIRELSRKGYLRDGDIRQIAASLEPSMLLHNVLTRNTGEIARATGVTQDVAERLVESFSDKEPVDLYALELVTLPDRPEVTDVVAPGREKQLRELSTGQKGTVIIGLAMIESLGPLVVDQPEEPLDTQSIYGQVVKTLRKSKEDRQFIFTTHNPNVAVGADAELSHILDATADKGIIESSGAIDHEETNKLLLVHLEGGKEALERRVQKYGL
jgi:hypothetical protein